MDPEASLDGLPRVRLCHLPTPIERMERLEGALGLTAGPELYVKRDDLTGLAFGGNKGRKLEFSLAEARQEDADTVLTCGAVQSNHCRQTAVAAAMLGFEAHLFLHGQRPERFTGNLIPSELCGATFHFTTGDLEREMAAFAERLRAEGRRPYLIPAGASNPTGAMGYVNAVRELADQERALDLRFDWVVIATGSGGTQAGLLAGARLFGLAARVVGMGVTPEPPAAGWRALVADLASKTLQRLGSPERVDPEEVVFEPLYAGPAYGARTEACMAAVRLFARREGLFLDPTYTAKAAAGLIDYVKQGKFAPSDRVLFVHTGGTVALFA